MGLTERLWQTQQSVKHKIIRNPRDDILAWFQKRTFLNFFSIQPSNKSFCRIYEYLRTGIITLRFFLSAFKNRKFKFSLERCESERVVESWGGWEEARDGRVQILIVLNNLQENFRFAFIILLIILHPVLFNWKFRIHNFSAIFFLLFFLLGDFMTEQKFKKSFNSRFSVHSCKLKCEKTFH